MLKAPDLGRLLLGALARFGSLDRRSVALGESLLTQIDRSLPVTGSEHATS
jgi:hypothetical protein